MVVDESMSAWKGQEGKYSATGIPHATKIQRKPEAETLWLSSTTLDKVDDEHYRALVIDKAQLPRPDNQSGPKRLIVESMASVGINADLTDIVYAPAP